MDPKVRADVCTPTAGQVAAVETVEALRDLVSAMVAALEETRSFLELTLPAEHRAAALGRLEAARASAQTVVDSANAWLVDAKG
jgi:hypothetical protein